LVTSCTLKLEVLDEGLLGFIDEYAKARRFVPVGVRVVFVPLELVNVVHPLHLAVTCQCVAFVCVPVLSIVYEAPVYGDGVTCPLEKHVSCTKPLSSLVKKKTYVANRDDTIALFPLAQETAKGLLTIVPPQAKPAQPTSTGATI
jgi:hypothetical protein